MSKEKCKKSSPSYMTIHIEELTFSAIIGILDFERVKKQKVIIQSTIDYYYEEENFINYADVISLLEKRIIEKKYKLLEDALEDITETLLKKYKQIKKIYLKITKVDIIPNAKVSLSMSKTNQETLKNATKHS